MIIYNVTINIEDDVHNDWLAWMKNVHIPDVMKTGLFTESRILKVIDGGKDGGTNYAVQYTCRSMSDFEQYQTHHAPALQKAHRERYKEKFVAFRTILEVIT